MTENPTVVVESEGTTPIPSPKKHIFKKKYVIALATAAAAVLVGGYLVNKNVSEEEEEELTTEIDLTEELPNETPEL